MYYTSNPMSLGDVRPNPAGEASAGSNFPGIEPDACSTLTVSADPDNVNVVYIGPPGIDTNDATTYWMKLQPGDSISLGKPQVPQPRISAVFIKTLSRADGLLDGAHVNAVWI